MGDLTMRQLQIIDAVHQFRLMPGVTISARPGPVGHYGRGASETVRVELTIPVLGAEDGEWAHVKNSRIIECEGLAEVGVKQEVGHTIRALWMSAQMHEFEEWLSYMGVFIHDPHGNGHAGQRVPRHRQPLMTVPDAVNDMLPLAPIGGPLED